MIMNTYLRIYRWSMQMKLRMGIYTICLLFCKIVWNWLCGADTVKSVDILTIWAACLLFSVLEAVILPEYDYTAVRTAVWAVTANLIMGLGALLFGWFEGIPLWGGILLFGVLELTLVLMWFGDNVAMKADTACLNKQLKDYQNRQKKGGVTR